ncbi:unannotated protein [freshwater metagenome]|uniref:Unannotated protein n=1 Tax=freshwater metagenome TaxID=449393 RepID=A0A6J6CW33_9ZZZZ
MPDKISRTKVCAPSPNATPITPAEAIRGPRFKPNSAKIIKMAINQILPLSVDFKTVLVVFARSFCRAPLRFGPGIRSALATRFISRAIDLWPSREIKMAIRIITVIFSGAPVNQSSADCILSESSIIR